MLEEITIKCYGEEKKYFNRKQAIKEFQTAVLSSEGSERDRYIKIIAQLCCGNSYCSDEEY